MRTDIVYRILDAQIAFSFAKTIPIGFISLRIFFMPKSAQIRIPLSDSGITRLIAF
jgi:hypothetical protein